MLTPRYSFLSFLMLFLSSSLLSPPPSTSSAYSLYTARRQWSQRARERAAGRHSRRDGQGKVGRGTQKDWRGGIKCIAVSPTVAPSGPLRFTMGRKEARLHTANHMLYGEKVVASGSDPEKPQAPAALHSSTLVPPTHRHSRHHSEAGCSSMSS